MIWAGHEYEAPLGLYHMQARWYDPQSGRFLAPDPLGYAAGDANLYRYVGNGPVNAVDPEGLDRLEYGDLQTLTSRQAKSIGYRDIATQPRYRVPVYYVDEHSAFNPFGEDAAPQLIGHYYPEFGYVEHIGEKGIDMRLGHGYRVSLEKLQESLGSHKWTDWFQSNHNDSMNSSANMQMRVQLGVESPDLHSRVARFQNSAQALAYIDLAFYQIGASLASPATSIATAKTALSGRRVFGAESVWRLGPGDRGFAIEQALGGNLPNGFRTFDRFADGVATSIKSINLADKSYRNTRTLRNTIRGYVDVASAFQREMRSGVTITSAMIRSRHVEVVVPAMAATGRQRAAIQAAVDYGKSKGVFVTIIEMH